MIRLLAAAIWAAFAFLLPLRVRESPRERRKSPDGQWMIETRAVVTGAPNAAMVGAREINGRRGYGSVLSGTASFVVALCRSARRTSCACSP